jgi:hypothetical protein
LVISNRNSGPSRPEARLIYVGQLTDEALGGFTPIPR